MSPFHSSARAKLIANDSGQAMVEFAFIVTMLLIIMSAAVDFGRVLNTMQIIDELSRQGSSLSSRVDTCTAGVSLGEPMETLTCSVQALVAGPLVAGESGQSGLSMVTYGRIIATAVQNTGTTASPIYTMTGQYSQGGIVETSRIGTYSTTSGAANTATVPAAFSTATGDQPLQAGQTMYVTEVFYQFHAITPIGTLTQSWPLKGSVVSLPSLLYDVAYF
jgi:Flp pilus assembly protein TadG